MVHDWGDVEDAATHAAEGRSPTGIKQIIVRTNEAGAAMAKASDQMVAALNDVYKSATEATQNMPAMSVESGRGMQFGGIDESDGDTVEAINALRQEMRSTLPREFARAVANALIPLQAAV
jgi:hypothetical protein